MKQDQSAPEKPVDPRRIFAACLIMIAIPLLGVAWRTDAMLTTLYFRTQDVFVVAAALLLYGVLALRAPRLALAPPPPSARLVAVVGAALALLLWGGTYLLMFDYPLTRDEHMVVFDMAIFSDLRLSQPLPAQWSGFARPLVPAFLLIDEFDAAVLVSGYLPGNAMMRTAFGMIADPALMNPLLLGLAFIALHRVARRLFPDCPGAVWVSLLAFLLSAQVLVTGMTAYAMTGHLALDIFWLALFLRGGRLGHAGALLIGVWAIGLHQLVFHPLFAGPFILTLLPQRRRALFLAYAVVYAAALLFWIAYPQLVMELAGVARPGGEAQGGLALFAEKLLPLLLQRDPATLPLMEYNLLRLAAWLPLFVLPLLLASWRVIGANQGIALPLAGGLLLTLIAVAFLLPYQGHGWGYRYLHGVIGNIALLCGYGYRRWVQRDAGQAGGVVLAGILATMLALPFLLYQAHGFVKPYARLTQQIALRDADFVLVDTEAPSVAVDQVRNLPDLSNRPLIFSSKHTRPEQIIAMCERGSLALAGRADFKAAGLAVDGPDSVPAFAARIRHVAGKTCLRQ